MIGNANMDTKYSVEKLTYNINTMLKMSGLSDEQAFVLADCLITADKCGVHSHGLTLLKAYENKIVSNGFNLNGKIVADKETNTFSVIDANNTVGAYSASFCMDLCIKNCNTNGIYTVFSHNANTFGPAFYYVKKAAKNGVIGFCMSNSPSAMPAWNGKNKILGTNPFAIGIPAYKYSPILIDMATSKVAKSKINEARKAGKNIPVGWALDIDGNPTTDPVEAINGMVLPMAEHKGYAISLAIDIIAGLLSGAGYLNDINRFYSVDNKCMNVGQMFVAIDPKIVMSEEFYKLIDDYIEQLHNSGDNVMYPGESKHSKEIESERNGVILSDSTVSDIDMLMKKYNL